MTNKKGFALIELLVVTALVGIVLSLLMTFFVFSQRSFNSQNEQATAMANARYAMDYLTKQIRMATTVDVNQDENSLKVGGSEIRLDGKTLTKNDQVIVTGIDDFRIEKSGKRIKIEIAINGVLAPQYKLNSVIYVR